MTKNLIKVENNHLSVNHEAPFPNKTLSNSESYVGIRNFMKAAMESTPDIIKHLNPDDLYRIKSIPEGAELFVDKNGDLTGTCRKNGKWAGHVRLEKMGPQLAQLAKGLGQQIVLVHIANQLHDIKIEINQIKCGLHDDRIAIIEGALATIEGESDTMVLSSSITPPYRYKASGKRY